MRISWVIGQEIPANALDVKVVKEVASSWGSWSTWKQYKTDNCICTNESESKELLRRAFHAVCNFYIMQDSYNRVGSPAGVKLFDGTFKNDSIANKDDIVALNLVAPNNDIVLMSGFDFSPLDVNDPLTMITREEYYFNINELMKTHSTVQFVLVDYTHELAMWAKELPNLSVDDMDSVKSLLV